MLILGICRWPQVVPSLLRAVLGHADVLHGPHGLPALRAQLADLPMRAPAEAMHRGARAERGRPADLLRAGNTHSLLVLRRRHASMDGSSAGRHEKGTHVSL